MIPSFAVFLSLWDLVAVLGDFGWERCDAHTTHLTILWVVADTYLLLHVVCRKSDDFDSRLMPPAVVVFWGTYLSFRDGVSDCWGCPAPPTCLDWLSFYASLGKWAAASNPSYPECKSRQVYTNRWQAMLKSRKKARLRKSRRVQASKWAATDKTCNPEGGSARLGQAS